MNAPSCTDFLIFNDYSFAPSALTVDSRAFGGIIRAATMVTAWTQRNIVNIKGFWQFVPNLGQ